MPTDHPTKPPDIHPGDTVTIAAFDDVPEHDFVVDEVHEDCVTGVAVTGPLTGCYGEPDLVMVLRVTKAKADRQGT
jgi:hypothetical protein